MGKLPGPLRPRASRGVGELLGRGVLPAARADAVMIWVRVAAACVAVVSLAFAQSKEEQQKLAREYLLADDARAPAIEKTLSAVPPLSKADAAAWTAWIRKAFRTSNGPRLDTRGQN